MPLLLVEHTFGEWVDCRTCLHGDIGDNEAVVVQWHVTVDRLREDAVAIIEEEYGDGDDDGKGDELYARPYLWWLVLTRTTPSLYSLCGASWWRVSGV
jgi:hypothetical protein